MQASGVEASGSSADGRQSANKKRGVKERRSNQKKSVVKIKLALDSWASFLEENFKALENEPDVIIPEANSDENIPDLSLDEVKDCVKSLKCSGTV